MCNVRGSDRSCEAKLVVLIHHTRQGIATREVDVVLVHLLGEGFAESVEDRLYGRLAHVCQLAQIVKNVTPSQNLQSGQYL